MPFNNLFILLTKNCRVRGIEFFTYSKITDFTKIGASFFDTLYTELFSLDDFLWFTHFFIYVEIVGTFDLDVVI